MTQRFFGLHLAFALSIAVLTAGSAGAQQKPAAQEPYKPTVGQPGRDAVWVPTTEAMVEKMLDVAKVTPKDFVMDLGSGDGRMIIAAAKRGAHGLGIEYNEDLVQLSTKLAKEAGVGDKAQFKQGDMYEADISKATVLSLFLLPSNLEKLAPKFLALKPGSRIVANTFWIDGWEPDAVETMTDDCNSWCTAKLFIIPANVEGTWRVPSGELSLTQQYQMLTGTFTTSEGEKLPIKGKLTGDKIALSIGDMEYEGVVKGDTMEGWPKGQPGGEVTTAKRVK